jgi:isoquinoline 1-oxidoreductase subunit beta
VQVPGTVYAAVAACPVFGGKLKSVDDSPAKGRRGVLQVVRLNDAVVVVADRFWRAKEALALLNPEWDVGEAGNTDSAQFAKLYRDTLDGTMVSARNDGNVEDALAKGKIVEAVYEAPHLAHATMEPLNATGHLQSDRLEVWLGTQSPMGTIRQAAAACGLKPEQIVVHNCFLGGGFGRRSINDEMRQAILVAKEVGKPVKLVWTREEDMTHDRYRPQAVEGFANIPYAIPNVRVGCMLKNTHLPVMFWRAVGSSQNAFFVEGYIDELAHAAGQDPYKFRRALLAGKSDFLGVLDTIAEKSDWGKPLGQGRGRGIAIHDCYGSIIGQVAEVTVSQKGEAPPSIAAMWSIRASSSADPERRDLRTLCRPVWRDHDQERPGRTEQFRQL